MVVGYSSAVLSKGNYIISVPFYLWRIELILKTCKLPKYYDQDCRETIMTNYIIVFQMPTMAEAALESLLLLIYHSSSTFNKNPCILKNLENSISNDRYCNYYYCCIYCYDFKCKYETGWNFLLKL